MLWKNSFLRGLLVLPLPFPPTDPLTSSEEPSGLHLTHNIRPSCQSYRPPPSGHEFSAPFLTSPRCGTRCSSRNVCFSWLLKLNVISFFASLQCPLVFFGGSCAYGVQEAVGFSQMCTGWFICISGEWNKSARLNCCQRCSRFTVATCS